METQDNGFLLVIDGVRKEKERLTAAKLFFLSFNPMVLSRLPALVSKIIFLSFLLDFLSCNIPT
jgi:hypothetical protein